MSAIDELLVRHRARASSHPKCPDLPAEPRLRVAVLTCMDARIDAARLLGLRAGDAHVLRNAGATVTEDMLRSLAISQAVLGTREILLIKHTRCGLGGADDEELRQTLGEAAGRAPPGPLGTFHDLEAAVRRRVDEIRRSPLLSHKDAVRGFVYDVADGTLREISC